MAKTVVGLFDTFDEAQNVVQDLTNSGFKNSDISLVANDSKGEYSKYSTTNRDGDLDNTDHGNNAAEGAGTGAVGGTVIGGAIGLLVGLGALAIPGIGPVIAAGSLATTLGSTALGAGIGAAAGGLVGALVGAGVPEEDANYYSEGVRRGGALVTVNAQDDMADNAYSIMQRHGAADIKERGAEYRQSGFTKFDETAQPYSSEEIDNFRTTNRGNDYRNTATTTATETRDRTDSALNNVGTVTGSGDITTTSGTVIPGTDGAQSPTDNANTRNRRDGDDVDADLPGNLAPGFAAENPITRNPNIR